MAAPRARPSPPPNSLHARHGGARPDSIFNGADDDGTGTVSVLEIAEAFAKSKAKPKRSILFRLARQRGEGAVGLKPDPKGRCAQ